jgi:hypothetical protein
MTTADPTAELMGTIMAVLTGAQSVAEMAEKWAGRSVHQATRLVQSLPPHSNNPAPLYWYSELEGRSAVGCSVKSGAKFGQEWHRS